MAARNGPANCFSLAAPTPLTAPNSASLRAPAAHHVDQGAVRKHDIGGHTAFPRDV